MDENAGRVRLGKIVCAPREYAPLCIRPIRFGMGAGKMASGRSPSMAKINTRRAGGAKVGIGMAEAVGVAVGSGVWVMVAVAVNVEVGARVGIGETVGNKVGGIRGSSASAGVWQASRIRMHKISRNGLRVRSIFMG
jgi:hypothetical protein